MLLDVGCKVITVVTDGLSANLKAMEHLGVNYRDLNNEITISGEKIHFLIDIVHGIKLLRNTLAEKGTLSTSYGIEKWCYIIEIVNIQSNIGLKFSNKLSHRHINYYQNKMKVSLAVQISTFILS